ncbi:hypothetical protein WN944_027195 [Citrus x changshan-huyou]|uniref:Uncharacterized protein n=1 Tax=Citrus x changshan-huyou TaxID=2935761 RepID=A0AAP0Q9N1_9ROSI
MDKNQNRSGITQSRFSVLDDLANEDMHPYDYDDDSVSQWEPIISIPENTQTLGPKSRSMKKKLTNPPIQKFPTRKATNPILPSQPTTENLDPNIQIFSKYSHPNSQPPTVHADKDTFCDFNIWETTVELEESPVTSRSRSPLAANDCSVGAKNGMEVEAEVFESSQ